MQTLTFTCAELTWEVTSYSLPCEVRNDTSFALFPPRAVPDLRLSASYGVLPTHLLRDAQLVFESNAIWSFYRRDSDWIFVQRVGDEAASVYAMAVIQDDWSSGDLYLDVPESSKVVGGLLPSPLVYPLTEILMVCLLAQGRGVMVHACGVDDGGKGYLFSGQSGAGKSTLAGLWSQHARILNDERIVLRLRDGYIWMYGTPWHSTFDTVTPEGVPLERAFFIRHAAENSVTRLPPDKAVSGLMARAFLPFWDAGGIAYSLDFTAQIAGQVPFFDLGVVPTPDIIDVIRCAR